MFNKNTGKSNLMKDTSMLIYTFVSDMVILPAPILPFFTNILCTSAESPAAALECIIHVPELFPKMINLGE